MSIQYSYKLSLALLSTLIFILAGTFTSRKILSAYMGCFNMYKTIELEIKV